ncbi:protein MON2 homolog isoform X2 [Benincasa hispida]|uniref:protein MON2 homolog isoform X2 n=1 Tax=Benincasa hispida TaxID=102211 RepID=UPI0019002B31|nr:protein MON2 homolog isoform X2 [Benincasa hispida]
MAFMAVLESDLRALSVEARRRHPAVKDGAEHAILKLRSMSSPSDIAENEDILRIFLLACEAKTIKLSVIGLSSLQKLISHDAVSPSALKEILFTLKDHAEVSDETVQLKTLQTILIIFQSRLHPENEENMAQALGICIRLLENNRSSDSVRNTAAATFRQAVALIFDHVIFGESLPAGKFGTGSQSSRTSMVISDVDRNINSSETLKNGSLSGGPLLKRENLTKAGKLGLQLLEDLTALAAGGSATWLRPISFQRTFALDILEFILSNYVAVFRILVPYEQVLRHQICSLLMTSLRTNVEVFLSMLLKVTFLDLPLWHRILVLENLRGFCMEARTLQVLFQNFDMHPKNTNVVEGIVKSLARVVSNVQVHETSEESLAAVAGMFSSKAKGIEWSLDGDASNATVLVASEAHAITLAVEGLLGVVFTVATLTDEAVDLGELESPRSDYDPSGKCNGRIASVCISMVDSLWLTILDALSLILTRSQGEAIVLEILKGYQAFTQACGVLHAVEPLNSFLASLCKFTINFPSEVEKKSILQSPNSKRLEPFTDQRDTVVLTPKNVQALRTLFNIAHRLHNVLGPSWVLVLDTLAALDRAIHSPHAMTQEVSTTVPKLTRESSGQYSDFHILSSLNSQLFESSALMHISAVNSLLSALCQLSHQYLTSGSSGFGLASSQKIGSINFSVERMICILVNNLHRVEPLWDQIVGHFVELANNSNQHVRNIALDALDQSICSVLGSEPFLDFTSPNHHTSLKIEDKVEKLRSLECSVISPLQSLYSSSQSIDVCSGSLKILLHVLERHGEKLHYSWPNILELLRSVADASEKDLVALGFQSLRVILNDGLSSIPQECLHVCVDVTGAYSAQKTELNISLTAIGLLWTITDFIVKRLLHDHVGEKEASSLPDVAFAPKQFNDERCEEQIVEVSSHTDTSPFTNMIDSNKLLFSVFSLLHKLGADDRPEVRNSAIRTLFQSLGSHGQKLSGRIWGTCIWDYVFPILDHASHMAATSSKDEWQGKELGTHGGKAVHMLIHHSRNTAQKQWDETLVLVLSGIARILRSFFPFLRSLTNFWSGWESLLLFVKNSILNGSKEVALAAINCLQTTVVSHSPKGNLPMTYLVSVLNVYELVLQKSPHYSGTAASKVKQEILHGLGELYVQAQMMFDNQMYTQLLSVVDLAIKQAIITNENFETEFGHVPPELRTILEILPLLRPTDAISSMWLILLREFLQYLPRSGSPSIQENDADQTSTSYLVQANQGRLRDERHSRTASATSNHEASQSVSPGSAAAPVGIQNVLFAEKLVPALVELFLHAPMVEKCIICPEIIQSLGRCMTTRREHPDGALWRLAVEGFNQILSDDVQNLTMNALPETCTSKPARTRIWKEVADVYEIFLVGYCGRALSSSLPSVSVKANESLEMTLLNILGDKILKSPLDAPYDVIQRLVSTLDRCASRTCSLPVETVELMPIHCSRFSLTCLHKLFSLSSYDNGDDKWSSTRCEVSKISILLLMTRCQSILNRFPIDENYLGERPLPTARLDEIIYILQELARLKIHYDTASVLPLPSHLNIDSNKENHDRRPHLLILFPSFCELVISREARVRELVQVLLKLITTELTLDKVSLAN